MSGDELVVTLASVALGPVAWIFWFVGARSITGLRQTARSRLNLLVGVLAASALLVLVTLLCAAADDVREAQQYVFMYSVMGWAWLRLVSWAFPLAGLHPRDDLLERLNDAAVPAWAGAMIGVACCFAGGNVGNGPGWWVVVFSAGLATAALAAVWIGVGHLTGLVESVTIDRDPAAGWRLGGLLAAAGIIFGFSVTGDWISVSATIGDFVQRAWPVVPIAAAAALLEMRVRPTRARPRADLASAGIGPALVFVGAAVVIVAMEWPR